MKSLLIGASAGVGRALSEELAAKDDDLILVASDMRDLQAQASHLRLVYGVHIEAITADANQPSEFVASIRLCAERFGPIDRLFLPIGVSRRDDDGSLPCEAIEQLVNSNLIVVMEVIELFLPGFMTADHGYIIGFGSVAALRGRRRNVVYSAAKRGLESYFESLRHITSRTRVQIQFYKLGYVMSQQTFGKNLLLPPVEPQKVAKAVVKNLGRSQGTIYFPYYWSYIAWILSALPWPIFRRMDL